MAEKKKVKKSKLRRILEGIFFSVFGIIFVAILGFQMLETLQRKIIMVSQMS